MSKVSTFIINKPDWSLWHHWDGGSAEDTLLTSFPHSSFDDLDVNRILPVKECTSLHIRAFGKDADNETATIQISGWNDSGPGAILWNGSVTMGAHTFTDILVPGVASGTWFEADTYTDSANSSGATSMVVTDKQGMLIVPTLGYKFLYIEAASKDGATGVEAASLAVLWMPYAAVLTI